MSIHDYLEKHFPEKNYSYACYASYSDANFKFAVAHRGGNFDFINTNTHEILVGNVCEEHIMNDFVHILFDANNNYYFISSDTGKIIIAGKIDEFTSALRDMFKSVLSYEDRGRDLFSFLFSLKPEQVRRVTFGSVQKYKKVLSAILHHYANRADEYISRYNPITRCYSTYSVEPDENEMQINLLISQIKQKLAELGLDAPDKNIHTRIDEL